MNVELQKLNYLVLLSFRCLLMIQNPHNLQKSLKVCCLNLSFLQSNSQIAIMFRCQIQEEDARIEFEARRKVTDSVFMSCLYFNAINVDFNIRMLARKEETLKQRKERLMKLLERLDSLDTTEREVNQMEIEISRRWKNLAGVCRI